MKFLSKKQKGNKGFTLLELLVTMAIFVVVTAVILFNQNKFSSDTALSNLTYEIALQIRQAQSYGLQVHQNTGANFDIGYGIHFAANGTTPTSTTNFIFFADVDGDGVYTVAGDGNPINTFALREGDVISDICVLNSNTGSNCFSTSTLLSSVDIVFKRPDPAASITDSINGSASKDSEVDLTVTSALGDRTKTIKVLNTGQISVQ